MSISVIFAFRNRVALVERSLQSLKHLDGIDVQVVAIDGFSSDGAFETVKRFSPQVLVRKPPNGVYDAWNTALNYCDNARVLFLNSDDELAPGSRELVSLASHSTHTVVAADAIFNQPRDESPLRLSWPTRIGLFQVIRHSLPFNSAVFSRNDIQAVGGFNDSMKYIADRFLVHQLLLHDGSVQIIEDLVSYSYNWSFDSLTMSGTRVPLSRDLLVWASQSPKPQRCALRTLSRFYAIKERETR